MTKNDLRKYKYICEECEQIKDQIETIKSAMLSPKNQIITGMPRGGGGKSHDRIGDVLSKIERLEQKYLDKCNQLLQEREKIENAISPLESRERMLIRYKYFELLAWEEVAAKLGCSVDNVYKLHGKILQKIAKSY